MAEQWKAVVKKSTGRLVSVASVVASPLPIGLEAIALIGPPDFSVEQWNETQRAFVPLPVVAEPATPLERVEGLLARIAAKVGA